MVVWAPRPLVTDVRRSAPPPENAITWLPPSQLQMRSVPPSPLKSPICRCAGSHQAPELGKLTDGAVKVPSPFENAMTWLPPSQLQMRSSLPSPLKSPICRCAGSHQAPELGKLTDGAVKVPSPFENAMTWLPPSQLQMRSSLPSPLKSPICRCAGSHQAPELGKLTDGAVKVPSPFENAMTWLPPSQLQMRSSLPSPLKSPICRCAGSHQAPELGKLTDGAVKVPSPFENAMTWLPPSQLQMRSSLPSPLKSPIFRCAGSHQAPDVGQLAGAEVKVPSPFENAMTWLPPSQLQMRSSLPSPLKSPICRCAGSHQAPELGKLTDAAVKAPLKLAVQLRVVFGKHTPSLPHSMILVRRDCPTAPLLS